MDRPAPAAFVPVLTAVFAQESVAAADDTSRTVTLVIGILLGLAVLLAGLTFWYWRRTDPRKRADAAAPARAVVAAPGGDRSSWPAPQPAAVQAPSATAARSARPSAATSGAAAGPATGTSDDRGISAEEWLRLTGSGQSGTGDRP